MVKAFAQSADVGCGSWQVYTILENSIYVEADKDVYLVHLSGPALQGMPQNLENIGLVPLTSYMEIPEHIRLDR